MKRLFTCIICPTGCEMEAEYEGMELISLTGNICPKGKAYVTQELVDPRRTIATSVPVKGGTMPLVSVRLTSPIPRDRIFDVMKEINRQTPSAPLCVNDVLIKDVLGLNSDIIITRNVPARRQGE